MAHRLYIPHSSLQRSSHFEDNSKVHFSPTQLANHAIGRVRMSLTAGVDLALLAKTKLLPGGLIIRKGAAIIDDKGKREEGTVAAHALPCTIALNGTLVFKQPGLAQLPAVRDHISEPYKYTHVVPTSVNTADLGAEGYNRTDGPSLVASFEKFCNNIFQFSAAESYPSLNKPILQLNFEQLVREAIKAFDYRIGQGGDEMVMAAARGQRRALNDILGSAYSPILAEEVEHNFYESKKISEQVTVQAATDA